MALASTGLAPMDEKDATIWLRLTAQLEVAERKHPVFAEGIWQGFGRIGEEYGELCQAVNHGEPDERVKAEALDLLTVVWRFVRGDYKMFEDDLR